MAKLLKGAKAAAHKGRWILHLCPPSIEQEALGDALRAAVDGLTLTTIHRAPDTIALIERGARPDLLLLRNTATEIEAASLCAHVKAQHPGLMVAVYGAFGQVDAVRWLNAGCDALLARDTAPDRFIKAVRFVLDGNPYVSPEFVASSTSPVSACSFLGSCGLGHPLLDQMPSPFVVIEGSRYVHLNVAAAKLVGYDRMDLLRRHPAELVAEPHREFIQKAMESWSQGAPIDPNYIVALRHQNGDLVWVSSHHCVITLGGRPAVLLLCNDVTDRLAGESQTALLALSPKVLADSLVLTDRSISAASRAGSEGERAEIGALTPRQKQVLELLGQGTSNKKIAVELGISEATAKLHVHRLLHALRARNRSQAVNQARRFGLIPAS